MQYSKCNQNSNYIFILWYMINKQDQIGSFTEFDNCYFFRSFHRIFFAFFQQQFFVLSFESSVVFRTWFAQFGRLVFFYLLTLFLLLFYQFLQTISRNLVRSIHDMIYVFWYLIIAFWYARRQKRRQILQFSI